MSSSKRKLQLLLAFSALSMLGLGVGCRGFFVNPTLTSIAVGPQETIQQGKTVQMSATGTFDDGSTKPLGSGVAWSSASQNVATISPSGLVMGVSPGQSTITGASGSVSGTATITVTLANLTAITVTPTNQTIRAGNSLQFTATGTANGKQITITDSVNWTLNPNTLSGVSIDTSGNLTTQSSSVTASTTIQVIATDPSSGISGTTNLTITP